LELLATIIQKDVLLHAFDVCEQTIATGTDNTPALSWQVRGSVSTTGAAAYLLRLQALHQCFYRYNTEHFFLPGHLNAMADDMSRLNHLSESDLLSYFNARYPQNQPWRWLTPRPAMISSAILALLSSRVATELYLLEPTPLIAPGVYGQNFVQPSLSTPYYNPMSLTRCTSSKFSPINTELAKLHPVDNPSNLKQWRVPSARWGRRWPVWGPLIHG
jgi:hypothetical protein